MFKYKLLKIGRDLATDVANWSKACKMPVITQKPAEVPINIKLLKYAHALKTDTVEIPKKPLPIYNSRDICTSHRSEGGFCLSPELLPKNYTRKTKSGDYEFAPHYKLDKLWASKKGNGTSDVQYVVLNSVRDKDTCGRVTLDACCLDGVTAPGAFYYKLGFRFKNPTSNKECEKWLKSGGKYQDAPFCTGHMYLPKENIEHCLKYGREKYYYERILPEYEEKIKRAIS